MHLAKRKILQYFILEQTPLPTVSFAKNGHTLAFWHATCLSFNYKSIKKQYQKGKL